MYCKENSRYMYVEFILLYMYKLLNFKLDPHCEPSVKWLYTVDLENYVICTMITVEYSFNYVPGTFVKEII